LIDQRWRSLETTERRTAQLANNLDVTLAGAKDYSSEFGPVAQLAERRSYKADVVSAILTGTTINVLLYGYAGRPGRNPGVSGLARLDS
jgi:hypothetical protein